VAVIALLTAIALPGLRRSRISANEAAAIKRVHAMTTRLASGGVTGPPTACLSFDDGGAPRDGYGIGCTAGVYWATPLSPGSSGVRGFATDASGRICTSADGSIPNMQTACPTLE